MIVLAHGHQGVSCVAAIHGEIVPDAFCRYGRHFATETLLRCWNMSQRSVRLGKSGVRERATAKQSRLQHTTSPPRPPHDHHHQLQKQDETLLSDNNGKRTPQFSFWCTAESDEAIEIHQNKVMYVSGFLPWMSLTFTPGSGRLRNLLGQSLPPAGTLRVQVWPLTQADSSLAGTGSFVVVSCSVVNRAVVPDRRVVLVGPSVAYLEAWSGSALVKEAFQARRMDDLPSTMSWVGQFRRWSLSACATSLMRLAL